MNSLGIDLEKGDKVVMEGTTSENIRTVTVLGGFGMSSFTAGTCLFVKLRNGNETRMDGTEIEKLAETGE